MGKSKTTSNPKNHPPKRKTPKTATVVQASGLSDEVFCEACGLSEIESHENEGLAAVPKTINWHGCDCNRWYHSTCTPFSKKTPSNFSCAKVSMSLGESCPTNKKSTATMFVPSSLKSSYGKYYERSKAGSSKAPVPLVPLSPRIPSPSGINVSMPSSPRSSEFSLKYMDYESPYSPSTSPPPQHLPSTSSPPRYQETFESSPSSQKDWDMVEEDDITKMSDPSEVDRALRESLRITTNISETSTIFESPTQKVKMSNQLVVDEVTRKSLSNSSTMLGSPSPKNKTKGQKNNQQGLKPQYNLMRSKSQMQLPSISLATILRNVHPNAMKQYCIELEEEGSHQKGPTAKRCRQGKVFPTEEEIALGAKAFSRPDYRTYADRAHTLRNKGVEISQKIQCAETLIDIIPNFESKSTKCERVTYISSGYFEAAQKKQGQIISTISDAPTSPIRSSSLSLPENVLRPAGPIPDNDTGSLDRDEEQHPISCEICHRVYGTPSDNEFQDILIRCAAAGLCKDQKLYHLGCFIPSARTIVDYFNPEETEKWRKNVICSRACMQITWKMEDRDSTGLQRNKGRKKKAPVENNEA